MKRLSEPDVTNADKMLEDAIARKKNLDYVKNLNANRTYMIGRYAVYKTELKALEKIGASTIVSQDAKDAIHSSFTSAFKKSIKEDGLKQVYEECAGVCPFCGTGKLEEIDHYIPKENYPEFTLYPLNLIPICNKCNKKKWDKFLDGANERKFINFYSDCIDSLEFLRVAIDFKGNDIKKTTKIKYTADFSKIADTYLKRVIEKHYKELDLLNRYADAANEEVSELFTVLSNQDDNDEDEIRNAASRIVIGKKNGQLKTAGMNDWKYLLYEKMLEVGYIDEMVKYICV